MGKQILELVGSVVVPATEKFVIKDSLTETLNVKIAYSNLVYSHLGERFFGKVEEPSEETMFDSNKLLVSSLDDLIISKLGGEEKVESRFSQISYLLGQQPNGQAGILITTNEDLTVLYVRDKNGILCPMSVGWGEGAGWFVVVYSKKDPQKWYVGATFLSPQF